MPILPDKPLTFTIEGDPYKFKTFKPGEGVVEVEGVFGPEYAGQFTCRPRSFDDRTAIENRFALRFPTAGPMSPLNNRHLDVAAAIITLEQVALKDAGKASGLPGWFDATKLGTEVDEAAVIAASEKFLALMNDAKKD